MNRNHTEKYSISGWKKLPEPNAKQFGKQWKREDEIEIEIARDTFSLKKCSKEKSQVKSVIHRHNVRIQPT